ncbi:MAG: TIGR03560 family F420-dependent LLM class oxidoreductase [Acidimicrobiales bacterium]|nr:TIGR03560 family F420-dependent LLM class oxidoreductase [Acidimicrobiales bacterium]
MRFSIWPSLQQPWPDVLEIVHHAERTGWDGIWVADHFMGDDGGFGPVTTPTLEATAALAALAGLTSRVSLGSLVLSQTYRHPAVLANWAATVDHVSHGRLILGVGAGWQHNEHEQYGISLPSPRDRIDRLCEAVQVLRSLLTQQSTEFDGRWFTLRSAVCEPKPLQQPLPILIGGKGDRMLRVVAQLADAWNMWSLPETLAPRVAVLERACEQAGRDPREIKRTTQALVMITDDMTKARRLIETVAPRAAIAGPTSHIAEVVSRWQELGVDEVIVPDFVLGRGQAKLDAMDAYLEQVVLLFR